MRRTVEALGGWRRVGLVCAIGLILLWLSLAITTNNVFARRNPRLAGVFGWSGAEVQAREAQALMRLDAPPVALTRAETLARSALGYELLNARAASTLGSAAALRRDVPGAARMFRYSETITRRDLPTQLWLIEDAVSRGDTSGALRHYDRAMSVFISSWNLLVPVLAAASAEPPIARALAVRLARRPNWWRAFIDQFISANSQPATAFPIVLPALRLNPRDAVDLPFLIRAIETLVTAGAYDDAWKLYSQTTGARAGARQGLRNGGFEAVAPVAPFDWRLVEGEGLFAAIQPHEGGAAGKALYLSAEAGHTGDVAQQLLLLGSGLYTLSGTVGGSALEADRPEVLVTCIGAMVPVVQITLPPATQEGKRFAAAVRIPADNCPAQWLSIRAHAPLDTAAPEVWIDALSMRRG